MEVRTACSEQPEALVGERQKVEKHTGRAGLEAAVLSLLEIISRDDCKDNEEQ